ncbi:hypothetical protein D9M68_833020 [compost metagenome]
MHFPHHPPGPFTLGGYHGSAWPPGTFEKVLLDMHDIGRNRILPLAIGLALATDEEHRERQLGQAQDQLVDPTGNPAAHVRPRPLEQ